MKGPVFGIDLGTTCSAIGWVKDGVPTILPVQGELLVPSVVSFARGREPLVGRPALNHMLLEPESTVRSSKRHMGTAHTWSMGQGEVSPSDVAAMILKELARGAQAATGQEVGQVVITVPAWFTQAQRADTRAAGARAGLEVVRLINEPTAAAMAHAHGQPRKQLALVYDLGGGTFDVSLVRQDGPVVEVLASHGDTRLGGDDFDDLLLDHVLERLDEDEPGLKAAVEGSLPAGIKLRGAVEELKKELSSRTWADLRVPFLLEHCGRPFNVDMRLERFELESLIQPLLSRTLDSVDEVLAHGALSAEDVDELLLVGGSSQIPMVWSMLHDRYGLEGSSAIPPERAVALGAAIQAAIVGGSKVDGILLDVAPFSLSLGALRHMPPFETRCFVASVVTPRNTPLPSRHTHRVTTLHSQQVQISLPVFQGSHPNPLANSMLGKVDMEVPPAPEGRHNRPIDVEFRHNLDGMVDIKIIDVLSGRHAEGRVAADGEQRKHLLEVLLDDIRSLRAIPGDGTDPDPWNPDPRGRGGAPAEPEPPLPSPDEEEDAPEATIEEARDLFKTVRRRRAGLRSKHPDAAEGLLDLAARGLAAADSGDEDDAIKIYDDLIDRLFDLGIFL